MKIVKQIVISTLLIIAFVSIILWTFKFYPIHFFSIATISTIILIILLIKTDSMKNGS